MRTDVFAYLAGPLTAKDGYTREQNVQAAIAVFYQLIGAGVPAFCPHLHVVVGKDAQFAHIGEDRWVEYSKRVIDRCTHVVMLPRWETSLGCWAEQRYAESIGKPIYLFDEFMRSL